MTGQDLALREIAYSVVKKMLSDASSKNREALLQAIEAEASRGWDPKVNGQTVGRVSPRKGAVRLTAAVVDDRALVRWAEENAPHMLTMTIRTSDQSALLDRAKKTAKDTGDMSPIPGIVVTASEGSAGVTVTPSPDAEALIGEAVRSGDLSFRDLLELT